MALLKNDILSVLSEKLGTNNFEFVSCENRSVSDVSLGFLSSAGKETIIYKVNGKLSELHVFVKRLPKQETHLNDTISMGSFVKEPSVYNMFLSKIKVNSEEKYFPECYLAKGNEILVLEDMTSKGYKNLPCLHNNDVEHTKTVLDSVARLHSESFAFERRNNCRLAQYIPDLEKEHIFSKEENHVGRMRYNVGIKALQKFAEVYLPDFPKESVKRAFDFMKILPHKLDPSEVYPNVLSHSDLTNNNIMFTYNDNGDVSNAVLLDFQCAAYRPPSFDIQLHLHCCTNRSFREKHHHASLKYYYAKLKEELIKYDIKVSSIFTWDIFEDMCKESLPIALVMAVQFMHFIAMPSEVVEPIIADNEKWKTYYQIDRTHEVLQVAKEYKDYRIKLTEGLTDLFEYFSKPQGS